MSQTVLNWFREYLCGRKQRTQGNYGMVSDWVTRTCGTAQGSSLSPLIFSIYISDIFKCLKFCSYHIYADDLQIYLHSRVDDLCESIGRLNEDLQSLVEWADGHGLVINANKTQSIIIGSSPLLSQFDTEILPSVRVKGVPLNYSNSVKNLGVIMNKNLTWATHADQICKKSYSILHQLRRKAFHLPQKIRATLVRAMIFPFFNYCSPVLLDMTSEIRDKMQVVQNNCVRFIFGIRWKERVHITPFYKTLSCPKLKEFQNYLIMTLIYKILKNKTPHYLYSLFVPLSASHRIGTRGTSTILRILAHSSNFLNNSFVVFGSRQWNSLPSELRDAPSLADFKIGWWKREELAGTGYNGHQTP